MIIKQLNYKILYKTLSIILITVFCAAYTNAHYLFIRLDKYYLTKNSILVARFMNGNFSSSEKAIAHNRFHYISLVTPNNNLKHLDSIEWRDDKTASAVELQPSEIGTYVIGASLHPKEITLMADRFNYYLEHDGIPDTLAEREKNNELNKNAHEKYSKHVKAIFQVGDKHTDNFKTPLNYPVEIIPLQNPYLLQVGQTLEVQCLLEGKPIANQFVLIGYEDIQEETSVRTNENGITQFTLKKAGKCYIKMIHMTKLNNSIFDYESKWATLTFELKN